MAKNIDINFKALWTAAAIPGVVLAAISTAYLLANTYITKAAFTGGSVMVFVLDLAKIVGCIWLMRLYMLRFSQEFETASASDLRHLGTLIAVLSALIFATVSMAFYKYNPEIIGEAMDAVMGQYQDKLDANSMNALDKMMENMPQLIFFSQFIYCTLYGWILSAILAGRIIPGNPFAGRKDNGIDEQ